MEELFHWEGNIQNEVYIYLSDLLHMEMWSKPRGSQVVWEESSHHFQKMVHVGGSPATPTGPTAERIHIKGLEDWFHIGSNHNFTPTWSTHNLLSCTCIEQPEVMQEYIDKECSFLIRSLGSFQKEYIDKKFWVIPISKCMANGG